MNRAPWQCNHLLPRQTRARSEKQFVSTRKAPWFYGSTANATSPEYDGTGPFPARVFEGRLGIGRGRPVARGRTPDEFGRGQATAHRLCGHLQFAAQGYAADASGPAAWQRTRHSPVSGESRHGGHDPEPRL